jgi:hypothetical protein
MTILPTQKCFDDALDYITLRLEEDPEGAARDTLRLVHAIALAPDGPQAGTPFAHAWVEDGDLVWASGLLDGQLIYFAVNREEYHRELRVQDATTYTIAEALEENRKSGHYGPWKDEYRALCGRGAIFC